MKEARARYAAVPFSSSGTGYTIIGDEVAGIGKEGRIGKEGVRTPAHGMLADIPIFTNAGGWGRANKVFDGKLPDLINELNEAVPA